MVEDVCEACGASNAKDAQFCRSCDAYLGWDTGSTTVGGHPVTATVPETVGAVATEDSLEPHRAAGARPAVELTSSEVTSGVPAVVEPGPRVVAVPDVEPRSTEVVLSPGSPVGVQLRAYNASTVVDGFVVEPDGAPGWLELSHAPLRLMPREDGVLDLALGLREGVLVFAQRLAVRLMVSSETDPTRTTEVTLWVTVPPLGPPATLSVEPQLLRLTDRSREKFAIRLDNRGANFPQSFTLSGSDPEGVVRFGFVPSVVQVPAGQVVEVRAHFMAPAAEPGQELSRQLTVTAVNDQGEASATLTVVQHAAPEAQHVPVTVWLSPRELRVRDAVAADFEVHVDNRGGARDAELSLGGRDPARTLTIALHPERLVAPQGQVAVARGRVQLTQPPPRGETATCPFTVVATDGVTDVEAAGLLKVTISPAPLTTAELRVTPQHLTRTDDRDGAFEVVVDNTRGREAMTVRLSGTDSHGTARFAFAPPSLTVPARATGRSRMTVDNARPPSGESTSRELEVTASDGAGRIIAGATFTQVSSDRGSLLRILLVLGGAALVLIGLLLPWDLLSSSDGLSLVTSVVEGRDLDSEERLAAAGVRVLLAVLVVAMLFGLTGKAGSLTRKSAFLIVLVSVAYVVAAVTVLGAVFILSAGLLAVWAGAVMGYVGGVLARTR